MTKNVMDFQGWGNSVISKKITAQSSKRLKTRLNRKIWVTYGQLRAKNTGNTKAVASTVLELDKSLQKDKRRINYFEKVFVGFKVAYSMLDLDFYCG